MGAQATRPKPACLGDGLPARLNLDVGEGGGRGDQARARVIASDTPFFPTQMSPSLVTRGRASNSGAPATTAACAPAAATKTMTADKPAILARMAPMICGVIASVSTPSAY